MNLSHFIQETNNSLLIQFPMVKQLFLWWLYALLEMYLNMLHYIFILNHEILSVKKYIIKICWQTIFCKYKSCLISSFVLAFSFQINS